MNLEQILKRLREIEKEMLLEGANLDELTKEVDNLRSQQKTILDENNKRSKLLEDIAAGTKGLEVRDFKINFDEKADEEVNETLYRSAFLKKLQGKSLTAEEQRTYTHTTENTKEVIPTTTAAKIYTTLGEVHPIVNDVKRLNVEGIFRMIRHTEITAGDAKEVAETEANADEQNEFVAVTLVGKKISKHIVLTYELMNLAIDEFEKYIVSEISQRIEVALARLIVKNLKDTTKGIAAGNVLEVAGEKLEVTDVLGAFAKLKDVGAVTVYSNRTTIYGDIATMENKNQTVNFIGNLQEKIALNLLGSPVKQEDALEKGEVLFLDTNQALLILNSGLEILRDRNVKTGDWTIAGHIMADFGLENPLAGALLKPEAGV